MSAEPQAMEGITEPVVLSSEIHQSFAVVKPKKNGVSFIESILKATAENHGATWCDLILISGEYELIVMLRDLENGDEDEEIRVNLTLTKIY
jgi:hypothetical protein